MTTFGVTPTGFVRKTLADITLEYETKERANIDPNVDVDADAPLGQFNGIVGNSLAEAWEALDDTYHTFDPNAAEGDALVNDALLTGTEKRSSAPSTVTCTLNLDAGASVPGGAIISLNTRDDVRFQLLSTVTNSGGTVANLPGSFECTEDGPIPALAGRLTVIVTPFSGWNSVTNALDASVGHNADNDITLRQRRQQQLALRGGSTLDAIVADLLEIESITDVVPLENNSGRFDADTGLPAHSFEMLIVDDGLTPNNTVAQTIFDSKPGGIKPVGTSSGTAIDANSKAHAVAFSRADNQLVYVILEVSISTLFPEDGEDQITNAVLTKARNTFGVSDDVVGLVLEAAAISINGVVDVTAKIGFSASPTLTDNLTIGLHQIARFDSTRLEITLV